MADLTKPLVALLIAPLSLLPSMVLAQEQAIGRVGAWEVRCAEPGTDRGVCYLAQGVAQTPAAPAAEIVAEAGLLAVRVPGDARLAVPMQLVGAGGTVELAWQTCSAGTCEAVLALDDRLAAGLGATASLSYQRADGAEPVNVAFAPEGLAAALPLLADIARLGVAAIPAQRPTAAAVPADPVFRVRSVSVTPSEYLSAAEIEAATSAFVGRRLRVSQAGEVAAAIDGLYRERNIQLAQALVEAVDPRSGRVAVRLLEAHVETLSYQSRNMSEDYLAFRLGFAPGMLADTRIFEDRLNRLALTDGVTAAVGIEPGSGEGLTQVDIAFTEPKPFWGYVGIDSFGAESTGLVRLTLGGGVRSLTGWNDPLSVDLVRSEGAASLAAGYSRVVTSDGGRVGLSVDVATSTSLGSPEVTDLSRGAELAYSHPVMLEPERSWTLSGAVLGFAEQGTIAGAPLIDQSGRGLRLASAESFAGEGWSLALSQSLTLVQWDDAIAKETDRLFTAAALGAGYATRLGEAFTLSFDIAAQVALGGEGGPARQQFGVSGPFAVRGYSSELSKDDSGAYARLQLGLAKPVEMGRISLSPFGFADYGRAWDAAGALQDPLLSVGVGAALQFDTWLSGQVFVARPLLDANGYVADGLVARVSLVAAF